MDDLGGYHCFWKHPARVMGWDSTFVSLLMWRVTEVTRFLGFLAWESKGPTPPQCHPPWKDMTMVVNNPNPLIRPYLNLLGDAIKFPWNAVCMLANTVCKFVINQRGPRTMNGELFNKIATWRMHGMSSNFQNNKINFFVNKTLRNNVEQKQFPLFSLKYH